MDSGNSSGSMQSSNGGAAGDNDIYDQDFDSRGESEYSISNSFLMNNPPLISTPHQNQTRNENPTFFHPQQQNLDHHATTPYSINHHHDPIWARPPYSSYPTINGPNFSPLPPPPPPSKAAQSAGPSSNPKKRTRASRRAPTTVLTTDTANFRQMVQEFTGIPAGPFSASRPGPDLFSGVALGPLYPPLVRPSPRKRSSAHHEIYPPSINMDAIKSNDDYPFLNIQPKTDQLARASMNIGNLMSGFLSRHEIPVTSANTSGNDDDDNLMSSRWRSRADQTSVVGSDRYNDGVQENNLVGFDGNIINNSASQLHVSGGYNLNLAEKGRENVPSSSVAEGTVASWMCPSD